MSVLLVGARWLDRSPLDEASRWLIALPTVTTVFLLSAYLGGARLELLDTNVTLRRSGLLGPATRVSYSQILRVELVDMNLNPRLVIHEQNGTITEIGPFPGLLLPLYRRRIEEARSGIQDGIRRFRELSH